MTIEKTYLERKRKRADPNLKPYERKKQQTLNGAITCELITTVYDINQAKNRSKALTFGRGKKRTREDAYVELMVWRRKTIKEIYAKAKEAGLI